MSEMLDDYLGEMKNCRAQLIAIVNRGSGFQALFVVVAVVVVCLLACLLLTSLIFLEVLGSETSWESSKDQEGGSCC